MQSGWPWNKSSREIPMTFCHISKIISLGRIDIVSLKIERRTILKYKN